MLRLDPDRLRDAHDADLEALIGSLPTEDPCRITAFAVAGDPLLGLFTSPDGEATFLTAVGLTADELREMQATNNEAVLGRLRRADQD